MVQGSTQIYIILGHPISQVKSPEIFNNHFRKEGTDAVMIPLDIEPAGLPAFVDCLRQARNVHGTIVTIPYKESITAYIDRPSPQVAALGVANTLRVNDDREIEGGMTDGKGFLNALAKRDMTIAHKHLYIIGCGGAGAAVAWDALHAGALRVSLRDINPDRALDLQAKLMANFPNQSVEVMSDSPLDFDVVLNATPLGMGSNDPLPMPIDKIPGGAVVTDAVTSPPITPFLKEAHARGFPIQSGTEMAAGQAPVIAQYFGVTGSESSFRV